MSLQVWLPFNGDTENYGVSGATITRNSPVLTSGIFGYAKTTGTVTVDTLHQSTYGSVTAWVYTSSSSTTGIFAGTDSTSAAVANRKLAMFRYPTKNDFHSWGVQRDGIANANGGVTITGALPDNKWTHIAICHDTTNVYYYINGVLRNTVAYTTSGITYETPYVIQSQTNGNKICDVRLYDHCLSKMEVAEIAKGLYCHYKLLARNDTNHVAENNIEYDCSGFGHNGTRYNLTFESGAGSPRYSSSEHFEANVNSYIKFDRPLITVENKTFTIAFWMKTTTPSASMAIYNGRVDVGGPVSIFAYNGKLRFDDGGQTTFNYTLPGDFWRHYVITRDETNKKLYVNGELIATAASTDFTTPDLTSISTIGMSSAGSAVTTGSNHFVGEISDFRVYGTTLTQAQVTDLYNTAIFIDRPGNVYGYEFKEE